MFYSEEGLVLIDIGAVQPLERSTHVLDRRSKIILILPDYDRRHQHSVYYHLLFFYSFCNDRYFIRMYLYDLRETCSNLLWLKLKFDIIQTFHSLESIKERQLHQDYGTYKA